MSIIITREGANLHNAKRFYCASCKCEFIADREDYYNNYDSIGDSIRLRYTCPCPKCGILISA